MNNIFRKEYKPLNDEQKYHIQNIKKKAQELLDAIYQSNTEGYVKGATDNSRMKLEECVMWAVKAIT